MKAGCCRMITIREVAEAAKVSRSTVSRVINDAHNVSPEARRLVLDTIKALGYSPNNAARSLAKRKTNAIGVVVNNLHDPFFHDLIKGFEQGAAETSYSVVFCSAFGGDVESKERYVQYLANGVTDGIILYGSYLSDEKIVNSLAETGFHYVLIENDIAGFNTNSLLIDNVGGAEKAVNYLVSLGHKSIAHISGNPNKKVTIDRFNGYLNAMHKNAIEIQQDYIQYTTTNYSSGYEKMEKLISLGERRPTAIFCSDDAIASYAIRAAQDLKLRVPEDISVMGFDNQKILPDLYRGPAITTVAQPLYQIGLDSIRMLTELLESKLKGKKIRKMYTTDIVIKESVAPPCK
jgi:LacI family transcriptional regulator